MTAPFEHVQVVTTVDDRAVALELARGAVALRLAACAQICGPITSVYRWDGRVEEAAEWACVLKTSRVRCDELTAWLVAEHPYDTPEVLASAVVAGAPDYLAWISDETAPT